MLKMSMVVPLFNEELRFTKEYWSKVISGTPAVTWVFVDDGSTDKTSDHLDSLRNEYFFERVRLNTNLGKAEALRHGMSIALDKSCVVGFIDSDGSFESNEVINLCNFFQQEANWQSSTLKFSAIFLTRDQVLETARSKASIRRLFGQIVSFVNKIIWNELPRDTQCGFKFFYVDDAFRAALDKPFKYSWFFEIELLIRLKAANVNNELRIKQFPLQYCKDVPGSKVVSANIFATMYQVIRIMGSIMLFRVQTTFIQRFGR